jgi:hypothetical protein
VILNSHYHQMDQFTGETVAYDQRILSYSLNFLSRRR